MHIRLGKADAVIAGGSEAVILPLFHGCFEAMRVLAQPAEPVSASCRPIDLHRTGFIPGEGGATLVLEELEHARARGARIYAEVIGSGSSNDAFDMAQPEGSARGIINAMQQAVCETDMPRDAVGYVNTHGTGTQLGDKIEVLAVKTVFGDHAPEMLLSSIKAATGHMMGASGALEVSVAVMALHEGIIPPTLNYETPDPECDLDCVPNEARKVDLEAAMSISVGLGGHNAAVLLKRWSE
jgi:3-oxoacyl-[acyl-carrier-protein] synthase II/nodulation protein E